MSDKGRITSNDDLRDVSFVLRNLFKVGSLSAAEILRETGNMMPKFREQLLAGSRQISSAGWSFSDAVKAVFPEDTMPAIRAGEESGSLEAVFDQIWKSSTTQGEINKVIKGLMMPVFMIFAGLIISAAFFLFLIPSVYAGLSQGADDSFEPSAIILMAVDANAWLLANLEMALFSTLGVLGALVMWLSRASVREAIVDWVVKGLIKIKPLGIAYSQLKFGVMAQYLQIVSMAGLNADRRVDLVFDVLPVPLRRGLRAFRAEMFDRGIRAAASGEGRSEDDPRTDDIQWPTYIRLAFSQCHEGDWETPMREFGQVLVEEGKERMTRQIAALQLVALIVVGVLIVIPIGLLYTTMGQVLTMRMQML